jgi:hypothetical protein
MAKGVAGKGLMRMFREHTHVVFKMSFSFFSRKRLFFAHSSPRKPHFFVFPCLNHAEGGAA